VRTCGVKNLNTCVLDICIAHMCVCVCVWSGQSEFMILLWLLNCGLFHVIFLILVVNFSVSLFLVTTLGLDLFSGTYLNELLFLWFTVVENNSI